MKILFLGDIVGEPGRNALKVALPQLRKDSAVEFVIANAENAAGGSGITPRVTEELFSCGVDVLTSGDHIWKKRDVFDIIDKEPRILRPENFPSGAPGRGHNVFLTDRGVKVGVINLQGRVFMEPIDCPFQAARRVVEDIGPLCRIIIVDLHAEATSEKVAMGWFLDGRVSAVLGTHTHVQTADERILPQATAYITDVGMTGPLDSVIGRRTEAVLARFLSAIPQRFEVAQGNVQLQGVVVDVDEQTGRAKAIQRVQKKLL